MKRLVVISDLHCGHLVGLTHPDFDRRPSTQNSAAHKLFKLRRLYYNKYKALVESLQPIDVLIVNGDAIDGRGEKSGSSELIALDRNEQSGMAIAAILECKASKGFLSYGTAYHTGTLEDWEKNIANKVGAIDIVSQGFIDVNGLVFDFRHHVGSSSVPYGRHTAVAKEKTWGILRSQHGEFPKSDVLIRSHVHYFAFCGGHKWLALTTPALQGYGTKYGERRCSGTIDWGLVYFDIESKEKWSWTERIYKPRQVVVKPIKV